MPDAEWVTRAHRDDATAPGEDSVPAAVPQHVCPRDRAPLLRRQGYLCPSCGTLYPIVGGIPVLIDDETSVFEVASYLAHAAYAGAAYGGASDTAAGLRRRYRRFVRTLADLTPSVASLDAPGAIARMRLERPGGRILVVGAGDADFGGEDAVYTDVAFGRNISCICDAHALPYPAAHFDGALAVAVLEHVADPVRCVEEIRRVLKPSGLVYAATPFLQPVHMAAHDFTRFTYLGHRRLFRCFDELESGPALGPATAAALALQHVLADGWRARRVRAAARLAALLLTLPLKQLDRLYRRGEGAYDGAAGFFFYGRVRATPFSDREIIGMYRGVQ